MVVRMAESEVPMIIWAEPSQPLEPGELDDPAAESARWIVGAQTMLLPDDAIGSYGRFMRLIAGALDGSPAILDGNLSEWYPRETLEEVFLRSEDDPPAAVLWVLHAVTADGGAAGAENGAGGVDETAPMWLHTHGLWRCGRPELEMLDVPRSHADAGAALLSALAELVIEHGLPPPGEPFEIGAGLEIAVQPWEEAAKYVAEGAPGSASMRAQEDESHQGVRAVVCAATPEGSFRKVWTWPRAALDLLERDEATLYSTRRATARQERIARRSWPDLAMAFASLDSAGALAGDEPKALFLLKVAFNAADDKPAGREHLWFRAVRFEGDRARGELLNQPIFAPGISRGDEVWIDRTDVSDWQVLTRERAIGPADASTLAREVDSLRERPD
jgi:uncharacterized protein YegJ (DUF2314 family)